MKSRLLLTLTVIAALASGCGTIPVKPDRTVTHEVADPCVCSMWVRIGPLTEAKQKMQIEPGWLLVPPEAGQERK